MTIERLQKCSMQSLRELAKKEGIVLSGKINKDILIELILEALEEDREEREKENNPAMRIRETHYDILMDEEVETPRTDQHPLLDSYNETKIVLLLRDPTWAFAYWEIKSSDLDELKNRYRNPSFCLRVRRIVTESGKDLVTGSFDIPVGINDRSWYINLPEPGGVYEIVLVGGSKNDETALCRSNRIYSPAFKIPEAGTEQALKDTGNDLELLSKLYNFGDESAMQEVPHRIISQLDTQYLRIKG